MGSLELIRCLGRGGMGEVWLARQDGLERHVAVKILPLAYDRRSIERLHREAQALARIRHPHVVPVHEVGEVDGVHYYVMDLVEGRALLDVLSSERMSCTRAAEIARQIAEALAAAHAQGVVHRDIKPANVLLADGRDHVTVIDFGIALSETAPTLTSTGELLGTPYYMAPEQARGDAYLADARTDVWGVGVTLYEMLAGKKPFDGDNWIAVRSAVLEGEPIPLRRLRPDCPRDLETIVLRCLNKEPARRYPTARALADDLARLLADEPIQARRASLGYRFGKHVRRYRVAWLVGAITAVLGAIGLAIWVTTERLARRDGEAREAEELVRVASDLAERGDLVEAWTKLRDVELRFPHAPAVIQAYWAMVELARREQGEDDVLAQEVWIDRLLAARPPPGEAARAHLRLGRIYDKHGFFDDARDHYARAAESGALSPDDLEDARFGLRWTAWLGQHVDAELGGQVIGAGDLDGDGRDEVLVLEPRGSIAALRLGADRLEVARRWDTSELAAQQIGAPPQWVSIVDLNSDGRPDLVARVSEECIVLDLAESLPRRVLSIADCARFQVGDLDGDGQPEIVVGSGPPHRALRLVRVARDWSTREVMLDDLSVDETHITGIKIADLDGDGRAELIYAGGPWTRYDVRVARLAGDELHLIARAQLGNIQGLDTADLDGDGRPEILAVKSHASPSPRLFGDDPFLGPSGPMVLKLAGGRLERIWFDPLVPATAPSTPLSLGGASGRTRLGPMLTVVPHWAGVLRLYFGRPGTSPIRRDLRRIGAADLVDGGNAAADLDGDGHRELVLGGPRITAYGVGPVVRPPRRERRRTGADWLSTARELRETKANVLALEAYRAAVAHGADPVAVAFEEGLCYAQAERWDMALARFGAARRGGRGDPELWRHLLEAAEAAADWQVALDAARALGDPARVTEIEKLRASQTVFLQDFAGPWRPEWRVEEPLACRGHTGAGALGLTLLPGDRVLALPVDWDGSSLEVSAVVRLRDVQYAKGFQIEIARDDGRPIGAGGVVGAGGGGVLSLHTELHTDGGSSRSPAPSPTDWGVFPERVILTLSYVAHIGQWRIALHDLAGKRLDQSVVRVAGRYAAGRYVIRLASGPQPYLAASLIDLYRFELRAAPGSLSVVPRATSDPPPRCLDGLTPAHASDPLHRAFALATAGRIADAARELSAWRRSALGRVHPQGFELDEHRVSEFEAGLVRFALLDDALASAVVEAGALMPRREWGVLLRRLAYQQHIDSGQTHWREGVIALQRATALAPDDAHGWYMLGYCWYQLRDLGAARRGLERSIELDPTIERRYAKQGGPALLLARIAAQQRDAATAARWLESAVRNGGNVDSARRDRALRDLLGDRLRQIIGG
jgi:tetratricopeptide (TPR) repeat protein